MSEAPKFDLRYIEEWVKMKPPQREGCTREGFPKCSEAILPRFLVFPYIGLAGNILVPIDQEGMRPLEVRVIFVNKIQPSPQELS